MGAFKLGKMTFGSLFKKPETVLYPIESKPQPAGLKGHIVIDADRCIVCGMCERNCSTDCIRVDRKARTWEINPFACVQCGYCVTVCPKDCLAMDPDYFPAGKEKTSQVVQVPEQVKEARMGAADGRESAVSLAKGSASPAREDRRDGRAGAPSAPDAARGRDDQLERLIGLMDDERAARVKAVLAR